MERLTVQEEEAMQAVWLTGEGNVKSFLEKMEEPLPPRDGVAASDSLSPEDNRRRVA